MVRHVFNRIETAGEEIVFELKVSMLEIYNEKCRDLLDTSKSDL